MSSKDRERHGMHIVHAEGYENVLRALMTALEPHHAKDPELHQLYLETQWLLSNQLTGALVLPTSWDLIVFKMVKEPKLHHFEDAHTAAVQLVSLIKHVAHCTDTLTG